MIKILIRFDDICPTMDWEQWSKAECLLKKYSIKPLLGVIPDCQDPDLFISDARADFWDWVLKKQEEGYTIAMHGYNHVFGSSKHGILNRRPNSEFAGLPYEKQLEKIKKGKEILQERGIRTDIFFAPAHSFDVNTVKALKACGFNYISDGKSLKSYYWGGIKFLPCRNSGSAIIKGSGYYTSLYHAHEWRLDSKKWAFTAFQQLLENFQYDIVDFENYKNQPAGWFWKEHITEKCFVYYECVIKPKLYHIKKRFNI